jgi:competence protein ComEA
MADEDRPIRPGTRAADRAAHPVAPDLLGAADDEAPDDAAGVAPASRVVRARAWVRATPSELVGLTVLLTGALLATVLVWWGSSARADRIEAVAGERAELTVADAASAGTPVGAETSPGPPGTSESSVDDGHGHDVADADADAPPGGRPGASPGGGSRWVMVHVSGAVVAPGLVTLPAGSRVDDAVSAAGGMLADGDHAAINLARSLDDGEHVHVPAVGEPPPPGPADPPPAADGPTSGAGGPVDLNRASVEDLQTLPGIGPARAAAIVEHRETVGPFVVPGDLRGVPGIGEKTFQALADRVVVR